MSTLDMPVRDDRNLLLLFWALPVAFLVAHLSYINTPFVNLEFITQAAATDIATKASFPWLAYYLDVQANPLGVVFLTAPLQLLPGAAESFWSARIVILVVSVLFLFAAARFLYAEERDLRSSILFAAFVAGNPMIWLYSSRVSADVVPMVLAVGSLMLLHRRGRSTSGFLLSSLLLGAGLVSKYTVGFLCLAHVYVLYRLHEERVDWHLLRKLFLYFALPAVLLFGYLGVMYARYDIFIYPDKYRNDEGLALRPGLIPFMFARYAVFLGVMLMPFPLLAMRNLVRRGRAALPQLGLVAVGTFVLAACLIWNPEPDLGEMNFGALDHMLPAFGVPLILMGGLFLFCTLVADLYTTLGPQRRPQLMMVLLAVVPYLLLCSATRPAQRYLMSILPLLLYACCLAYLGSMQRFEKLAVAGTLALLLALDVFASVAQVRTAEAALDITLHAQRTVGLEAVDPGEVKPHAGQFYIPHKAVPKKYVVLGKAPEGLEPLYTARASFFGVPLHTYGLYPQPQNDEGATSDLHKR
jgi:hypothetical protein